jgi:hypothetical protein
LNRITGRDIFKQDATHRLGDRDIDTTRLRQCQHGASASHAFGYMA